MQNVNSVTHLVGNKRILGLRMAVTFVPRLCCPLLLGIVFLLTSLMLFTVSLEEQIALGGGRVRITIPKVS